MHRILFTGHMIDKPGRSKPRFPADKEHLAKAAIRDALEKETRKIEGPVTGMAGGACGGDILFHEACEELCIETELYLALPVQEFIAESVEFANANWTDRFNRLCARKKTRVLSETKELRMSLQSEDDYSIWERSNLWMLNSALSTGGRHMTLIALWDGKGGDGAGGTEHMVKEATESGATTLVIDTRQLFALQNV